MSDIFSPRKAPRHLVIREEYELRLQHRHRGGRWLLWGLSLATVLMGLAAVSMGWWQS